jgi:hypothetical protein
LTHNYGSTCVLAALFQPLNLFRLGGCLYTPGLFKSILARSPSLDANSELESWRGVVSNLATTTFFPRHRFVPSAILLSLGMAITPLFTPEIKEKIP